MSERRQSCYLLELPAELRLLIYEYVFPISTAYLWVDSNAYRWRSFTPKSGVSLLASCRTIYREAAPVFHNKTTVHFCIWDEFERLLSRYKRFNSVREMSTSSFNMVNKVKLSVHTQTEPQFEALLRNIRQTLRKLDFCTYVKSLEVHFEFWSTMPMANVLRIYDVFCEMEFCNRVEIGTHTTGHWACLYEAGSFKSCLEQLKEDVMCRSRGDYHLMQNESFNANIGARDIIISSAAPSF